jgi:light-regulated signal transduction histidine kinase (bacteriophytochrome)
MPHHEIGRYGRRIVETVRHPLVVLDGQLRVRTANQAFYRVFQIPPAETLDLLLYDLGSGQWDSPELRTLLEEILPQRGVVTDFEFRHRFPHLGPKVMLLNAERLEPGAPDEEEAILLAIEDITERTLAEERLRAYARRLEHSNRELQEFAQVASHDLQEPLRKIQAFGDLLKRQEDHLDNDGREYLDSMLGASVRMRSLINALLNLARVATRGKPFVPVDLRQVVTDVLGDLETRLLEVGGQVEVGLLPQIDADPIQMRQLFQNLIGNALKYREEATPPVVQIVGRTFALPGDGQMAEIRVQDHGIGFDEKYLDRIFAPFQRLHARRSYEGTGMGLAICRRIVERHGGTLTATSQPGQGATFHVTLPVLQQETT